MHEPYWIAFGDIHDDISRFAEIPEIDGAQGVIITGDITLAGGIKQAVRVMEPIRQRVPEIYAVIGNMDRIEIVNWLEEQGWNLHGRGRELFPGVMAVGVGGSPFTPFGTPSEFPESRLAEWMDAGLAESREVFSRQKGAVAVQEGPRLVLVSHTPPQGTACDRLHDGTAVGSTAVREFIEEYQPDLCLCGHIHESRADDSLGRIQIVNPGTLLSGGYVLIRETGEGENKRVRAELKILP